MVGDWPAKKYIQIICTDWKEGENCFSLNHSPYFLTLFKRNGARFDQSEWAICSVICLARSVRNFRLSHVTGKYPLANILVEQTRKTYVAYVINVAHKFLSIIQRLKTLVFGIWSVRSWRPTEVRIFTGGNAFSGTIFFICSSALSALMFKSVEHMIIKWGKSTFFCSGLRAPPKAF